MTKKRTAVVMRKDGAYWKILDNTGRAHFMRPGDCYPGIRPNDTVSMEYIREPSRGYWRITKVDGSNEE